MLRKERLIQAFLVGASWTCVVTACLWKLRAGTTNVASLSSDSAIPILIANDRHWDLFQCFFYGQDRFGTWPFLLIRIAFWSVNEIVRWEHVQLALVAWVLAGSIPFSQLFQTQRSLAAFQYLLAATMNPDLRILFDVSPYGWQVTALVLAWWCIRLALQAEFGVSRRRTVSRVFKWLAALVLAMLSTWISPVSGPLLLALGLLEAWRLRLITPEIRWFSVGVTSALPAIAATLFEFALRSAYHSFARRHFGSDYRTPLTADWTNLGSTSSTVFHHLSASHWSALLLLGLLGSVVTLAFVFKSGSHIRKAVYQAQDRPMLDSSLVILGTALIAFSQVPILILSRHVRMNDMDGRYFTLIFFFGSLSGLSVILTTVTIIARNRLHWDRWCTAVAVVGMGLSAILLPRAQQDPGYARQRRIAAELARRAPGAVLLSDYWDTYELASLEPRTLLPLPFEGDNLRMPWHVNALQGARKVIVGVAGSADNPPVWPPTLTQYGAKLYLVEYNWYSEYGHRYSLYTTAAPSGRRAAAPSE